MNAATTTRTIRAIHINPFDKTITEIDMPNDFEGMKANLMKCEYAEAVNLGEGVTAWIDEEGTLLNDWSAQGWTMLGQAITLAGHLVLTGTSDEGDMTDMPAGVTLAEVMSLTRFIDYKAVRLPGTSITTMHNGRPKTEWLGPKWRTHDNH